MWNAFSITNPNGYCDGYCNCNRDGDSYGNGDTDCHSYTYSYTKTHSNPETPSHTEATSDPTASSLTVKPKQVDYFLK